MVFGDKKMRKKLNMKLAEKLGKSGLDVRRIYKGIIIEMANNGFVEEYIGEFLVTVYDILEEKGSDIDGNV